jgi:DNA-binding response OmpR family regulator
MIPVMHILVIEDNRDIAANIGVFFEHKGHILDFAEDGLQGLELATTNRYDVIVLDLMLPRMDGLEVCRKLREDGGNDTPVLMLTARDTLDNKLEGYAVGSDDYLLKPFSLLELEARLTALHRRAGGEVANKPIQVGDLVYNPLTMDVARAGKRLEIKPTTKKILVMLMRASNRVVPRTEIELKIWGDDLPDGDPLRVHIYSIRNAIDKPFDKKLLHTVHGVGYRLTDAE